MGDWVDANFACQLEMELNAANERIKRLEEAGDGVVMYIEQLLKDTKKERVEGAKEAKP